MCFLKNFLILAEEFFPGVVAFVIRGDDGFDESMIFFGDDFSDFEIGMARN